MRKELQQDLPAWTIWLTIFAGLLLLSVCGWRVYAGQDGPVGASVKVHPGMYDLRAEWHKAEEGRKRSTNPAGL